MATRIRLTAPRIEALELPEGRQQTLVWDTDTPSLQVRVTRGAKSYCFEARLNGRTIRITIGRVTSWTLGEARTEARRLRTLVDQGIDPREERRQRIAETEAARAARTAEAVTVGDVWPRYMAEGRPKRRDAWKPRYIADLQKMVAAPRPKIRGKGLTLPGHLYPLMAMPLAEITQDSITAWHRQEAKRSKVQAARAFMMFRGFLRWASLQLDLRELIDADAAKAPAVLDALPATKRRTDHLEQAQIAGWWRGTERLENRTAAAFLQALLLTGARREEMATLTWENVDFHWERLTIADKVTDSRTLPLTPYLAQLLVSLPRINEFVFASTGKAGRITDARKAHAAALEHASIGHVTFHGLRRSYSIHGEASGCPAGALAQIMGHQPSALAEGYRPRTIDQLRPYAEQVERYILGLAGIEQPEQAVPGLRVVA